MISVFLVVDQPETRAVLRLRLELEADIVVVGEAGYDAATVAQVVAQKPDVVILDTAVVFSGDGADGARLRALAFSLPVVYLTLHDDPATRRRARAAGARFVVGKHGPDALLLKAIRATAAPISLSDSDF